MVPDQHAVAKGDTLWDICETYFHDPWRWPKIWALNPEITNPHWIFPGQTLRLGGMTHAAAVDAVSGAVTRKGGRAAARPPARSSARRRRRTGADGTPLREVGFVDAKELTFAGTINGSREEKIMLASGDQAYIEFSRDKPLKVGERFTVYQVDTDHPVKDPDSSSTLGYLVRIYGDVSIDALTDRPIASGTLLSLAEPVERGYRVGPALPPVQDRQAAPERHRHHGARGRRRAAQSARSSKGCSCSSTGDRGRASRLATASPSFARATATTRWWGTGTPPIRASRPTPWPRSWRSTCATRCRSVGSRAATARSTSATPPRCEKGAEPDRSAPGARFLGPNCKYMILHVLFRGFLTAPPRSAICNGSACSALEATTGFTKHRE